MGMKVRFFPIFGSLILLGMPLLRADDLLTVADRLVSQHLSYIYGSEDLRNGGLDCSGFVQIVFRDSCGIELPNEADKQLEYCREHGQVWDSTSAWTPETLQPGDLIFFAGPYDLPRTSRVVHVMIYCGYDTMMGAQALGRREDGIIGGVGEYFFNPRFPSGILGESGERFIGHRRVFAYGRLNLGLAQIGQEKLASWHVASTPKVFGNKSRID
jgi:cell wall-associated NlpC family hydrolase